MYSLFNPVFNQKKFHRFTNFLQLIKSSEMKMPSVVKQTRKSQNILKLGHSKNGPLTKPLFPYQKGFTSNSANLCLMHKSGNATDEKKEVVIQ